MNDENSKNLILQFDIFKHQRNLKDISVPDVGQKFLSRLQDSINIIKDEILQKYILTNDAVPKVMNELEQSLNCVLKKNMHAIKSIETSKKIKLGELYRFSVGNNETLKKLLNSIYLTSRIYKELYKDHPLMDNLKLRLISVRCKAIRDFCLNESRRGKIRHLRCWKNPKFIPAMPRKLKSILRKINKELQKYASKDSTINPLKIEEMRKILTSDRNNNINNGWETIYQALEEIIISYYKNVDCDDSRAEQFLKGLQELCQTAQQNNKLAAGGETAMLNLCDQERTMEYLAIKSEYVENDFNFWDRMVGSNGKASRDSMKQRVEDDNNCYYYSGGGSNHITNITKPPGVSERNKSSEIEAKLEVELLPGKEVEVDKEDSDILDFDNFQLVDVWEEKTEENGHADNSNNEKSDLEKKETRSARRKRRSRFGPLTEEAVILLQQPRTSFGFCSTFVDEDTTGAAAGNDKLGEHVVVAVVPVVVTEEEPIVIINRKMEIDEQKNKVPIDFSAKMFDVVAPADEVNIIMEDEKQNDEVKEICAAMKTEVKAPIDKGELCKTMLRKFHDSLKLAIEGANQSSGNWPLLAKSISESWGKKAALSSESINKSAEFEAVSKEVYNTIENKMNVLMRDYFNHSQLKRKKPIKSAPVLAVTERKLSPSPTPFDQSIEASMKKTRIVPPAVTHPVVGRRPTRSDGQTSPEKARLRAMMLSYKRDIVKSREFGDKREEGQVYSSQGSISDECGMADLVSKTPQFTESNVENVKNKVKEEKKEEAAAAEVVIVAGDAQKSQSTIKSEKVTVQSHSKKTETANVANTDSEGLVTSSDDDDNSSNHRRKESKHKTMTTSTPKENKVEKNRMQWLIPPPETVNLAPIPAPATPFLDDEAQSWSGRKVFVVDSHDKGSAIALMVKAFLQKNGARVYDTTNYKQAGKDLHVLVHQDWRFPDSSTRVDKSLPSSPISLLMLKNNAGVHFLSYTDVETVSRFSCQTVFPHSRSCIFLDQHALTNTHADNIRNMLDFMITERQTSNRIWCLKIPSSVYKHFSSQISENSPDTDVANLKDIQGILTEYSTKYTNEDSLCLVEIQTGDEDITNQQDHVLNQQYYLQKKFRHFCILTDNLCSDIELDIGFLSTNGVAVLSLNTFLANKTGKYIKKTPQS